MALLLFMVLPAGAAVPYLLGPEGFESGVIPSGWTQENVRGTCSWTVEGGDGVSLTYPTGAKSGAYRAVIKGSTGQVGNSCTRLITPAMNLTQENIPQIRFSHAQVARSGFFDTLRVYYRVNATAPWQLLAAYTSDITAWTTEVLMLPSSIQGTAYQIAFEVSDNSGLGVVLDDISVFPTSRCQNAVIQSIVVGAEDATIESVSNGDFENFEVVVSTQPITDWATVDQSTFVFHQLTDETEVFVSGLAQNTMYYVYVRTDCADNESGYTDWVSAQFKTKVRVALPYAQDFNTTDALNTQGDLGMVAGWSWGNDLDDERTLPYVYSGTFTTNFYSCSIDSTQYVAFVGVDNTNLAAIEAGKKAYIATPELTGNLQSYEVDFWATPYKFFSNGKDEYAAELTVGVMTDPNEITSFEPVATVRCDYAYQFKHFHVSLKDYAGQGKYVALMSMAQQPNAMFVDNLSIHASQSATPSLQPVRNLLPTGFDVTPTLYGADSWNLIVASSYVRDASALAASDIILQRSGLTSSTYQVQLSEAQIAGQTVLVYVQGVTNGATSEWSMPLTVRVPQSGVVPMEWSFTTGTYDAILAQSLVNENHTVAAVGYAVGNLWSPMRSQDIYPVVSTAQPVYDGAYLLLNGVDNYIVLPYVNDLSSLELVFRLSAGSASNTGASRVAVGVMTDPTDLSTFTELGRYDGPAESYMKVRQSFAAYTGNGHYVAVRALNPTAPNSLYGSRNNIDALRLQQTSACLDPTGVNAVPTSHSAVIRWNPNGMTNFVVKVFEDANRMVLDTMIVKTSSASATVDSVTVEGLTSLTTYYYTVQTICASDTLQAEDYYSFLTELGIPFRERFEDITSGVPAGWSNSEGSTPYEVYRWGSYATGETGRGMRFDSYNNGYDMDNYLATPAITLDDAEAVQLIFSYMNPNGGNFEVLLSSNGGNRIPLVQNLTNQSTWTQVKVDVSAYIGTKVVFYFHATSNYGNGDAYVYLDNVQVLKLNPNCQGLTNLSAAAAGPDAADITCVAAGEQNVYLKLTAIGETTAAYEGFVTDTSIHITGLTPSTTYNVMAYQACMPEDTLWATVRTECGVQEISQFNVQTFNDMSDGECWMFGVADTTNTGSTNLQLPQVTSNNLFGNVLTMHKRKNVDASVYGNKYYAILPNLNKDSVTKYQLVFDAATALNLNDPNVDRVLNVGVLTDLQDFSTFEVVETILLPYAIDSTGLRTFAVGLDTYIGDYQGDYGEYIVFMISAAVDHEVMAIIDNIRLEPVGSCHSISDLEITGKTENSVQLQWSSKTATSFEVVLTEGTDPQAADVAYRQVVSTSTHTATGLQPNTQYNAYVRAICAQGDTSIWTAPIAVMTECTPIVNFPWTENFDSYSSGVFAPGCWRNEHFLGDANAVFEIATSDGVTNSGALVMKDMPVGNQTRLELPYMNIPQAGAYEFRLCVKRTSEYDYKLREGLLILVTTNTSTDTIGYVPRVYNHTNDYVNAEDEPGWYTYGFTIPAAGPLHVVVMGVAEYGAPTKADNFEVRTLSVCPPPAGLTMSNIMPTSAYLSWISAASSFEIELAKDKLFTVDTQTFTTSDTSFNFVNLLPYTSYYARVKVAGCEEAEWSRRASFITPAALPFTELFESGYFGSGWERFKGDILTSTVTACGEGWGFAQMGGDMASQHIYMAAHNDWNGPSNYSVATPNVMLNAQAGNEVKLQMDLALTDQLTSSAAPSLSNLAGHVFAIGISTDQGATWTFDSAMVWREQELTTFAPSKTQYVFDLSAYAGQSVRILFFMGSNSSSTYSDVVMHIDNLRLKEINPNCIAPEPALTDKDNSSLTFSWPYAEGETIDVQIAATMSFEQVIDSATISAPTHTFTGLNAATEYFVRTRKHCSQTELSFWSDPVSATTACSLYPLPFTEGFETMPVGNSTSEAPVCWDYLNANAGNAPYIFVDNTYAFNGGNSLYFTSGYYVYSYVVLPEFTAPINELKLQLSAIAPGYYNTNKLQIGFMVDASSESSFVLLEEFGVKGNWQTYTLDCRRIPATAAGARLAIRYGTDGYQYLAIDDIAVTHYSPLDNIINVNTSNVSRTELDINWLTAAYSTATDFQIVVSESALDSAGLEAASKVTVTGQTYHADNLNRETTYYIYVRTQEGDVYGNWMSTTCTTKGLIGCDLVVVGSGEEEAQMAYKYAGSSYSEQIYTAEELRAMGLSAGPITKAEFYCTSTSAYDKTQSLYIGATTLSEFTENSHSGFVGGLTQVMAPEYRTCAEGWQSFDFTTPFVWDGESNIVVGFLSNGQSSHYGWNYQGTSTQQFRSMYGYSSYNDIDASDLVNTIGTYSTGQMYVRPNIRFTSCYAIEACPSVTEVSAVIDKDNITQVSLQWTASEADYLSSYDVFLTTDASLTAEQFVPQYTGITATSYLLTNLEQSTVYYAYIRANCQADGHDEGNSQWVMVSFKTRSDCMPIEQINIRITDIDEVEASWTTEEPQQSFAYVLSTTPLTNSELAAAQKQTTNSNGAQLTNLQLEQDYYLYVAVVCGSSYSEFVSATFTTPSACPAAHSFSVMEVGHNAVTLVWEAELYAQNSNWEVGLVGQENTAITITGNTAVLYGLSAETNYVAYLKPLCSASLAGDTLAVSFTTAPAPSDMAELGNESESAMLVNSSWGCTYSQHIYTASELLAAGFAPGMITAVEFDYSGTSSNFQKIQTLLIGQTTANAFSDQNRTSSALFPLQVVYGPETRVYASGWQRYEFATPFAWDGESNIVVGMITNTDGYSDGTSQGWSSNGSLQDDYRTFYGYCDNTPITPADHSMISSFNVSPRRPNIHILFAPSTCHAVRNLMATDITTEHATVSWHPGMQETSWEYVVSNAPLNPSDLQTAQKNTVSTPYCQINGLTVDQDYYVYVRGACLASEMSDWASVHFITPAECTSPDSIELVTIGSNNAAIAWTASGISYEIAYGEAATFDIADANTYQIISANTNQTTITGLEPMTGYALAIRSLCDDQRVSRWSQLVNFTTDCGPINRFPWAEDFDQYATGEFEATCWINRHVVSVYDTYVFNVAYAYNADNLPTNALMLNNMPAGNITQLLLPEMNLSSAREFTIDVRRTDDGSSGIYAAEGFRIYLSATDTIDATAQLLAFIPRQYDVAGTNIPAETASGWHTYSFVLPTWSSGRIIIEGVSQYGQPLYLDNLYVGDYDPNCAGISNFTISNISVSSALLSWQAAGSNEVGLIVKDDENELVFADTIQAQQFNLTGLEGGRTYYAEVEQLCSGRKVRNSFTTILSLPYLATFNRNSEGWTADAAPESSYYYWVASNIDTVQLAGMDGFKYYLSLSHYYSHIRSRLMSPEIYIPQLEPGETVRLDWLMGSIPTPSSMGPTREYDPNTVVSLDVKTAATDWTAQRIWSGDSLIALPWDTTLRYSVDLTAFAGQSIRLGLLAEVYNAQTTTTLYADNFYLRVVKGYQYDASTCSSVNYQDEYFFIPSSSYQPGTTDYETFRYGVDGAPDTLITLHLTVNEAVETVIYDTICEGRLYDRNGVSAFTATTSVEKAIFLTSANGCDSLVRLNIEVIPTVRRDTTIFACKGSTVTVNGKTYFNNKVVTDTLAGVNTCDSIVRTFIEFSETEGYTVEQHRIICAGDTYTDAAFPDGISKAGTYTNTVTTAYGCDSTVTIHMSVATNGVAYDTVNIEELPYVYAEDTILGTNVGLGDHTVEVQATCGQVTLHIIVTDGSALDNVKVLQLSVAPNPAVVGEPIEILSQVSMAADFRLMVFDAIGQLVYSATDGSLTIPGLPVAGYYTVRLTSGGQSYQAKLLVK